MLRSRRLSPAQALALGFLGLIAAGSALLTLPAATSTDRSLTLVQALFTATSAVCVTGLVVVDTATDLSIVGQIVTLALIQLGGLGYMTVTTIAAVALGRRVTMQERLALQEGLNVQSLDGLLRFAGTVFKLTLAFEVAGALVLFLHWWPAYGWRALYLGLFHSISAFNNAGFSLFSTSLMQDRGNLLLNVTIMTLFVAGGCGYIVLSELLRRRVRLSLHTRFVLVMIVVLAVAATAAIFLLERHNPASLGPLTTGDALLASTFQALTPRTAGFNTLDIAALGPPALFVIIVLMFIGAAPGGTGGGVKVTTFGITIMALWATVRGRLDTVIFRRRLSPDAVARAFFICLISFLAVNIVAGLLLILEGHPLLPTLFETISAFGTVGLSTGANGRPLSLSADFSPAGQLLITTLMFAGRLGPLTLAVALARGRPQPALRYPEGKVLVG